MGRPRLIKLCEGHKNGFGLVRIMQPDASYRGTPLNKLVVKVVPKHECIQCTFKVAK